MYSIISAEDLSLLSKALSLRISTIIDSQNLDTYVHLAAHNEINHYNYVLLWVGINTTGKLKHDK